MEPKSIRPARNILIVSSHPLFGKGIQRMLQTRYGSDVRVVGMVTSVEEAVHALESLQPDLVVVDYDDGAVNREEFLSHFLEGERRMRVVLFSLKEGGSNAIVYDRRSMAASQVDDWLQEWAGAENSAAAQGSPKAVPQDSNGGKVNSMSSNLRHIFGVLVFVVVLATLGLFVLRTDLILPVQASLQAETIDFLFGLHFRIIAVLFALIVGSIIYSVIFFRSKPGETEDPQYQKGDASLNITWVIFPMLALFAYIILEAFPIFRDAYSRLLFAESLSFDIGAAVLAVVLGLVGYFALYLPGKEVDAHEETAKENNKLEVTWTAIPLGMVLVFAFLGSGTLADVLRIDPRPLEVRVIGQQWSWRFEYPDQGVTSTELVLPVNQQVLLRLTSEDVIHSFWVPEFRVKQDAIPGGFRELRVTPKEEGTYMMVCTELCGQQHAYMTANVQVLPQAEFETWLANSVIPEDPIARGEYWYRTEGCVACHSLDGSKIVGPSFLGLYGRTETFIDGTSLQVDDAYIKESILNPYARIVEGYELSPGSGTSAMPANYGEKLSDEQIAEIIEFIKTLK